MAFENIGMKSVKPAGTKQWKNKLILKKVHEAQAVVASTER
jgi:hypothetical protein